VPSFSFLGVSGVDESIVPVLAVGWPAIL